MPLCDHRPSSIKAHHSHLPNLYTENSLCLPPSAVAFHLNFIIIFIFLFSFPSSFLLIESRAFPVTSPLRIKPEDSKALCVRLCPLLLPTCPHSTASATLLKSRVKPQRIWVLWAQIGLLKYSLTLSLSSAANP